jgi:ribosomal protein L44E
LTPAQAPAPAPGSTPVSAPAKKTPSSKTAVTKRSAPEDADGSGDETKQVQKVKKAKVTKKATPNSEAAKVEPKIEESDDELA